MAAMNAALQGEALDPLARGNQDERRTVTCSLQALLGERARDKCQNELASCKIASSRRTRCAGLFGRKTITKDQSSGPCKVQDCGEGNRCTFFSMRWWANVFWGILDFACDDFMSLQQHPNFTETCYKPPCADVNRMCQAANQCCEVPSLDNGLLSDGVSDGELRLSHANSPQVTRDVILQDVGSEDLTDGSNVLCSRETSCDCTFDSENANGCPVSGEPAIIQAVSACHFSICALLAQYGMPENAREDPALHQELRTDQEACPRQDCCDLNWELKNGTEGGLPSVMPSQVVQEVQRDPSECCEVVDRHVQCTQKIEQDFCECNEVNSHAWCDCLSKLDSGEMQLRPSVAIPVATTGLVPFHATQVCQRQVTSHFDFEHDDEPDSGEMQLQPSGPVPVAAGLVQFNATLVCQHQVTCHFDLEHDDGHFCGCSGAQGEADEAGAEAIPVADGAELGCPNLGDGGFRPLSPFAFGLVCGDPRWCFSPPVPFGFRSLDPCLPPLVDAATSCAQGMFLHMREVQITSHFDLEHEEGQLCSVAGARSMRAQVDELAHSGFIGVVPGCPPSRTLGVRPLSPCQRLNSQAVPQDNRERKVAVDSSFPCADQFEHGIDHPMPRPSAEISFAESGEVQCYPQHACRSQAVYHFDLEHDDGQPCALAGARGVASRVEAGQTGQVPGCPKDLDLCQKEEKGPSNAKFASERPPWKAVPQCLLGLMQWIRAPSRVISHCYLLATRVGEASNPGPDPGHGGQGSNTGAQPAFDIGNFLGPNFGAMLQSFIQQQIQSAVQAAVQEAMQKFQPTFGAPAGDKRTEPETPPPKRRRKGKGQGNPSDASQQDANGQAPAGPKDKGKGKGNASSKPAELNSQQQGGRGNDKPSPKTGKDGKGSGTKPTPHPRTDASNQDGWTQVKRQRDGNKDAPFELRQQDWNAPLVSFSGLAQRLQDTKSEEVCRGVILCPRKEIETARALLAGTSKKYALLLIVLAKEYPEKPKDLQTQQVPGKIGNLLRAQDAYIQQAVSKGQHAPQPVGISSTPQKVATKATAVLFVKIPKAFTEGSLWKSFVERPQRQIAQWTAARHVLCIDCFQWAEEQLQGGRRQVHGVIRVAQADVSTLLAHSGEQGIFLQQPRDKVTGQHVEWAERISKTESDADYLTRVHRARGDLGLVCRDLSLGWRRPNDATTPVRKVWVLEHAPKVWDLQQVASLLQEQFTDINMFRQVQRGGHKNFTFRAACKRGCDADLVPVTVILDEPGGSNAPVTLWAKIAPPRHVEYKQRHIRGGAVPFFDKPSLFDPVAVASAPSKAETNAEDKANKGDSDPDPKRTCASKRPVPAGTILQKQPADGDCLFHTFSAGLHLLRKDKDTEPIHPHELRARTVAHMRRYTERYKPQWEADGKLGPTGKAVDSWEDFLEAISKAGAFAGDAELRALCRIYDIRVVLVPEAPLFPVCVFHRKASAKRTIAIYFSQTHFDLLAPENKGYPDEITQVSADPSGGFLVGGRLSARTNFTKSSLSKSGKTTWTSQVGEPSNSQLLKSRSAPSGGQSGGKPCPSPSGLGLGTSPLGSPPSLSSPKVFEVRGPQQPNAEHVPGERRSAAGTVWTDQEEQDEVLSQDLEGCEPGKRSVAPCSYRRAAVLPEDMIFRCPHCPFQKQIVSIEQFRMTRHNHMKKHHNGADLPGPVRRPKVQQVPGGAKNMAWKCPRCKLGIPHALRQAINRTVFAKMRQDHRESHHPEIPKAEWATISRVKAIPFAKQPLEYKRKFAEGCRRRMLVKGVLQEVRTPRFPGFQMFVWPVAKHLPGPKGMPKTRHSKQPIHRISLEHGWKCLSCHFASRTLNDVRAHAKSQCTPSKLAHLSKKRRLESFKTIREWIATAKLQHEEAAKLTAAVDAATAAITQVSSSGQPSSSC